MDSQSKPICDNGICVSDADVKSIVSNYLDLENDCAISNYSIYKASDQMLGYIADYWKLKCHLTDERVLSFFIKAISRCNPAKANMIRKMKLFDKELSFYSLIRKNMMVAGLKPFSSRLIATLDDAMVFEDLNALGYKVKNKFDKFDLDHTLQSLNTLARFHASSIIFEERRSIELQRNYSMNEDFNQFFDEAGYRESNVWFQQCMNGALETVRSYSKYNKEELELIDARWSQVWLSALNLSSCSSVYRNVLCHRDLWNNNIMFLYEDRTGNPTDCLFVDFQAIRYQPPASDVMLLLCCNLDKKYREANLSTFLNYYYTELQLCLEISNLNIINSFTKEELYLSAQEQRKFGLIVSACIIPQIWLDDEFTTKTFSDPNQFKKILTIDKGKFIKKNMEHNLNYRKTVMEIFEEICDRYCL